MVLQWTTPRQRSNGRNSKEIKKKVFRDVKSGKVQIPSTESFASYADQVVNDIKCICLAAGDILQESNNIESWPKIHGTLEMHMGKCVFNEDDICKLKFFMMATDDKRFYQNLYQREGDPEVCDHPVLPFSFN